MMVNHVVWWIGKEDGSTGYEVVLEQRDLEDPDAAHEFSPMMKVEPGGDAMAIGMMIGNLDWSACAGARWYHTERDPRTV